MEHSKVFKMSCKQLLLFFSRSLPTWLKCEFWKQPPEQCSNRVNYIHSLRSGLFICRTTWGHRAHGPFLWPAWFRGGNSPLCFWTQWPISICHRTPVGRRNTAPKVCPLGPPQPLPVDLLLQPLKCPRYLMLRSCTLCRQLPGLCGCV